MYASAKHLMVGSALLLAAVPVLAAEETPSVAPAPAPTAVVACHGVTNIPFTADEEQALPLRIVGSLSCGETVAIVSDSGGYTTEVRTKDGQEGYVARIYLSSERSAPAVAPKPRPVSANPVNGVARWSAGAAGCDEFLSHGRHVESIAANGVTVQVSLQDTGWKYRVNVAVSNQSGEKVEVMPGIITLDELMPNARALMATSPQRLAHTPTHQVFWTLADAVPPASAVANYSGNGSVNSASQTPDYLNSHLALASERHVAFERTESIDVQAVALKAASLPSGQLTAGVMWFDRDSNAHELSLRVPVGNMVFDYSFSLKEKK